MANNSDNVRVIKPRVTGGAVLVPSTVTAAITDAITPLPTGVQALGYVGVDGLVITIDKTTVDIKDWSKATIRTIVDEISVVAKLKFMEVNALVLGVLFGPENVTELDGTITVKVNGNSLKAQHFVFDMVDGEYGVRVEGKKGTPVVSGDLSFVAGEALEFECEINFAADENGDNITIFHSAPEAA
jgi:hypothetical protein